MLKERSHGVGDSLVAVARALARGRGLPRDRAVADQFWSKWIVLCRASDLCLPHVLFQHQSTFVQVKSRTHGLDLFGSVYWCRALGRDPGAGRGCFASLVAEVGD